MEPKVFQKRLQELAFEQEDVWFEKVERTFGNKGVVSKSSSKESHKPSPQLIRGNHEQR